MARSAKRSGKKRRAKISFNSNTRKNKWKRQKKSRQHVACPQVQESWDGQQNAKTNMENMGLAYNINKIMKVPSTKDELKQLVKGSKDVDMKEAAASKKSKKAVPKQDSHESEAPAKSQVVQALEQEAETATAESKKRKQLRLSQPEIRYCIYMMEKYGEDYDRMARDAKNAYQDTPAQIRRKIDTFKSIPIQYNAYLRSKGLLVENGDVAMETS